MDDIDMELPLGVRVIELKAGSVSRPPDGNDEGGPTARGGARGGGGAWLYVPMP